MIARSAKNRPRSGAASRRWAHEVDAALDVLQMRGSISPALVLRLRRVQHRRWPAELVDYAEEMNVGHERGVDIEEIE
jgi:hypothetical protein